MDTYEEIFERINSVVKFKEVSENMKRKITEITSV